MHVTRIGFTNVKGMTHVARPSVDLDERGPVGDRAFCLVDVATSRVVRTAPNDLMMACEAIWKPPTLEIRAPNGMAVGDVDDVACGPVLIGEYWNRPADVVRVDGPWTELLSDYLGRPVVLCRVPRRGAVVWAGSVSIATTSSLAEVARRIGRDADDGSRFRPTFVVDTGDAPPFIEDTWIGRSLTIGGAQVSVGGTLARCVVVDRLPGAGGRDADVLKALAPDRTRNGDILFGVHGDVLAPATVSLGDPVHLS